MTAFANPAASIGQFVASLLRREAPTRRQDAQAPRQAAAVQQTAAAEASILRLLPKDSTLVIEHPFGREIGCVSGMLWITHDGDIKDIVLAAGDLYTADRDARMLVHAVADAVVRAL